MSVLLFIVGALALMAGAVMVGFGIPINEFSFGNTLIAAGATTFMGGLVILGLAAVVAQLQRVVEALATRPPLRASRPMEPFDQSAAARGAAGRIPFPPRPKSEGREPQPAEARLDLPADGVAHEPAHETAHEPVHETEAAHETGLTAAPTMRNPDEAAVAVAETEELSLSPFSSPAPGAAEKRPPAFDAGWPPARKPQTAFFDTMWPAPEPRPAKTPPATDIKPERRFESKHASPFEPKHEAPAEFRPEFSPEPEAKQDLKRDVAPEPPAPQSTPMGRAEQEPAPERTAGEVRAVAILKSGVVDGMGYTLYVDGSIEAELPQGTLRFASINELRNHLEKAS